MKDLLHNLERKAIYVLLQKQVLNAKQIVVFMVYNPMFIMCLLRAMKI